MVWKYQVRGLKPLSRFKLAWEFQMTATLCRFLFVWSYFVFFFYDSLKKSCQTKWRQDDMTHPYSCHLCQLKTQKKRALSCLWVLTFLTRMAVNKHESNRGSHRLTLLSWGLLAVLVHLSHLLCCRGEKKNNIFLRNINSYIYERCSILLILCFKRGLKFFWTYLNSFRMWRFLNGINRTDCFLTG